MQPCCVLPVSGCSVPSLMSGLKILVTHKFFYTYLLVPLLPAELDSPLP